MTGPPLGLRSSRTRMAEPIQEYVPFAGGFDLETPTLHIKPGKLRRCLNFEADIFGGYRRIKGYERFDGRASPSDASYAVFPIVITGVIAIGDAIAGSTSGATAVVVAVESGDNPNLIFTKLNGTFTKNEELTVSGAAQGQARDVPTMNGATDHRRHAAYNNLAADAYRSDITAVPGSGGVLGVWMLDDVVYAWRNNESGTETDIYQSTSSGWSKVLLGRELTFTSGSEALKEGDTITGSTSLATATIDRVVLTSGSWADGDAAGKFIVSAQTGAFQAENLDEGADLNIATIYGDSAAITLAVDGRYEFVNFDFSGAGNRDRIYSCDGVNRGFEFDGTVLVPIDTGMSDDTPDHIIVHEKHLFFSFGASVQHSGIGAPYQWSPVLGAAEINIGASVTGFMAEPGSSGDAALGIYANNRAHILYGNSSADWNLVQFRENLGAKVGTIQNVGYTLFLDDRGLANLRTSQVHGNFSHSYLTRHIQPWMNKRRTRAKASCIVRDKSQYRLFFDDSSALYATFDGAHKVVGLMPINLNKTVTCIFSMDRRNGTEMICFGSDDGYVYQMEKGTSFDGEPIDAYFELHFNHSRSPRLKKTYKSVSLEVEGDGYAEFGFSYSLGYGSPEVSQPDEITTALALDSVYWGQFTWDQFIWDGQSIMPRNHKMDGNAENVSFIIRSHGDYSHEIKFNGALLRYLRRRYLR